MDHDTRDILVIAAVVALVSHIFVRKYGWACLVTILVAPFIFMVESIVRLHLPPSKIIWFQMAFPFLALLSLSAATAIGLPFLGGDDICASPGLSSPGPEGPVLTASGQWGQGRIDFGFGCETTEKPSMQSHPQGNGRARNTQRHTQRPAPSAERHQDRSFSAGKRRAGAPRPCATIGCPIRH